MIDIWGVLANSLWILGVATILATFSWAHWVAQEKGHRLRTVIDHPRIQQVLNGGGFLFCAGLAFTSHTWWKSILWGLLTAAWAVRAWLTRINARKTNVHRQGTENADTNDNGP